MRIYLITDSHFKHRALIEDNGRPPNFDDILVKNWNRVVADEDILIHLGDVYLGPSAGFAPLITSLPGRKWLLLGNHDRRTVSWYLRNGFDFVGDWCVFRNCLLSHQPVQPLPERIDYNIFGHYHGHQQSSPDWWKFRSTPYYRKNAHRYLHMSIEHTLAPVEMSDFIRRMVYARRGHEGAGL